MNSKPTADQQIDVPDRTSTPVSHLASRQHSASEAAGAEQLRPTCLLAIGIHELGRTADLLRAARSSGDEALAKRVQREQEGWSHFYEFTCQRICSALRTEPIEPEAASVFADAALAALPSTVPGDVLAYLRRSLTACASYRDANACPFLNPVTATTPAADKEIRR